MERRNEQDIQQAAHILINGGNQMNGGNHQRYTQYQYEEEDEDHLTYSPVYPSAQNSTIQMSDRGVCSSVRVPFSRRRRLFCLLTVFDFLLMVIFWFLCVQFLAGNYDGFKCQVEDYTFRTSMFDMVVLAFWRMVFLLLVYGLIRSEKWYAVGLTTIATSGTVICKTVLYNFYDKGQESPCRGQGSDTKFADVVILIASFIIVWFELWILDFKVIKRERRLNAAAASSHRDTDEQSPLLSNQSSTNHDTNRSSRRKKHQEFYSPFDSPADSELEDVNDEDDQFSGKESSHSYGAVSASNFESLPNSQRGSAINLAASLQEQAFIQKSEDSFHAFQEFLDGEYDWTVVKSLETATISVCTADIALNQILFKLEAVLPATPEHIFTLMWDKCEDSVNWNPTIKHIEVVQEIGCDMQVLYTVANSILVSSRDFVSIRQHKIEGQLHVVSDISIEHSSKPVSKEYVRGTNGLGGWVVEPDMGNSHHTRLRWFVNSDIKLKLCPQNMFRQVMSSSIGEIYQGLSTLLKSSAEQSEISSGAS